MATENSSKSVARLEARVDSEVKALWQKAADLEGRTLTDFVIASVQAAAYKVVEQHQTLKLSVEDSEAFVNALIDPPKPNAALKAVVWRYKNIL